MINKILDSTIYFSFDSSGFKRHAKSFEELDARKIKGKNVLITGGTSGIGLSCALELSKLGANVIVTGRNEDKLQHNLKESYPEEDIELQFLRCDLNDFSSLKSFVSQVKDQFGNIDVFICNAGGMPDKREVTRSYDGIFASQVVAHYFLIRSFIDEEILIDGSHVSINSSGGMYPVKLDLADLAWVERYYDKVASYAMAKRAQVIISELLAENYKNITFSCSHPGWVDTPGLKDSLKSFWEFTKDRLRSVREGADTLIWLATVGHKIESGKFWFDRKMRSPNLIPFTKVDFAYKLKLRKFLEEEVEYIKSL